MGRWFCGGDYFYGEDEEKSGLLHIPYPTRFSGVPFRCVSDNENTTAPDNASEPLTFKVQCEFLGCNGRVWLIDAVFLNCALQ